MKGLLLTYLVAYGGSAVALRWPFIGVLIYWMLDIVRPQEMFAWAGAVGSFSYPVAIATIVGWAFRGCGTWRFGRARSLIVLFICFALWSCVSALAARDQEVSMAFLFAFSKSALMFIIAVTLVDSVDQLKQMAWVIAGSAGYLSYELNMQYLSGFNQVQVQGYGGMDNNCVAILLVTCLGPAFFLGMYSSKRWQKILAFGMAALIAHAVLLTYSRGGMMGMILALTTAFIVAPKKPRHIAAFALIVALGIRFTGEDVRTRFMSSFADDRERDASAKSRLDLWKDCLIVMERYPVFGVGPNHFPLVVGEFGWPAGKEAHSLWLQTGAEIGILGMIALFLFYVGSLWLPWRAARSMIGEADEGWFRHAAYMVTTALVGFMFSAQFVSLEGLEAPFYVAAIAVGSVKCTKIGAQLVTQAATAASAGLRRPINVTPMSAPLRRS